MTAIQHDDDLADVSAGRRNGPTVLLHGCRDVYLAVREALADLVDPSLRRSPASPRPMSGVRQPDPAPASPTIPESTTRSEDRELIWELRRMLALSGRTLADVAQTLETEVGEVDDRARHLLQDELDALDMDLATLKTLLSDPVDWDSDYQRLLAGDLPPFDDELSEEDDDEPE